VRAGREAGVRTGRVTATRAATYGTGRPSGRPVRAPTGPTRDRTQGGQRSTKRPTSPSTTGHRLSPLGSYGSGNRDTVPTHRYIRPDGTTGGGCLGAPRRVVGAPQRHRRRDRRAHPRRDARGHVAAGGPQPTRGGVAPQPRARDPPPPASTGCGARSGGGMGARLVPWRAPRGGADDVGPSGRPPKRNWHPPWARSRPSKTTARLTGRAQTRAQLDLAPDDTAKRGVRGCKRGRPSRRVARQGPRSCRAVPWRTECTSAPSATVIVSRRNSWSSGPRHTSALRSIVRVCARFGHRCWGIVAIAACGGALVFVVLVRARRAGRDPPLVGWLSEARFLFDHPGLLRDGGGVSIFRPGHCRRIRHETAARRARS
jgi:hypothetical protein